ncbi:MAG: AmmeMemoRadiSam system protein A [Candidatus Margulisiibacteriota bacterium]
MAEHFLVKLARETIDKYIREGKVLDPPKDLPAELKKRAGVFVSLHRRNSLRGCIGTFMPTTENVAQEVIRNAIEAATGDPRFSPLRAEELVELEISVDVLSEPEPVKTKSELNAKKYGVIVKAGMRRGLLLPDLDGVDTVDEQIEICRQKAGISPSEPVELFKFVVERFH